MSVIQTRRDRTLSITLNIRLSLKLGKVNVYNTYDVEHSRLYNPILCCDSRTGLAIPRALTDLQFPLNTQHRTLSFSRNYRRDSQSHSASRVTNEEENSKTWQPNYQRSSKANYINFHWILSTERFRFRGDTDDILRTTARAELQTKKRTAKQQTWQPNHQWSSTANYLEPIPRATDVTEHGH